MVQLPDYLTYSGLIVYIYIWHRPQEVVYMNSHLKNIMGCVPSTLKPLHSLDQQRFELDIKNILDPFLFPDAPWDCHICLHWPPWHHPQLIGSPMAVPWVASGLVHPSCGDRKRGLSPPLCGSLLPGRWGRLQSGHARLSRRQPATCSLRKQIYCCQACSFFPPEGR